MPADSGSTSSTSTPARVAVVVGASSGIGRACAQVLAAGGWRVLAAARRLDRLAGLQSELARAGTPLDIQQTDVCRRDEVDRLVATALERHAQVDVLVYATGTNLRDRGLGSLTTENWERMLATNLSGAFHCTQAVLPAMRAAGQGLLIYISSAAVQMPDVSGVAYQAGKHGLVGLAHGTRIEERGHGIRTTVIFPGLCDTEILEHRPRPTPREVLDQALLPEDVAAAVKFVAELPPRAVVPMLQILPGRLQ